MWHAVLHFSQLKIVPTVQASDMLSTPEVNYSGSEGGESVTFPDNPLLLFIFVRQLSALHWYGVRRGPTSRGEAFLCPRSTHHLASYQNCESSWYTWVAASQIRLTHRLPNW